MENNSHTKPRLGEWEGEGEGEGEGEEEEEEEECDFNCLHTISFVCFVISLLRLSSRCRG